MRDENMAVRTTGLTAYRETVFTAGPSTRVPLIGALVLGSLVLVWAAERSSREGTDHGWFIAVSVAGLFVARGLHLRRPITLPHLTAATIVLVVANFSYRAEHTTAGFVFLAASGLVLMAPQGSKPQPEQLARVAELVRRTHLDPVAPFALHSSKSYFFNADSSAAIAYRARLGIAVVAGDPIGDKQRFGELVSEFSEFTSAHGWRIAVLGASPELTQLWQLRAFEHRGLHPIPIGRDVVVEVNDFDLVGRRFRNLRQAVSRTRNFGVTTEVLPEVALTEPQREDLLGIVDDWGHGRQTRGFSMILDHLLDGRHPGMLVVLARDESGQVAGFQRYGVSGNGRELSLDVPWRRRDAPNGLDERMIVDLVEYARAHGVTRISLAFAAFPELFGEHERSRLGQLAYVAVRLGDPLIRLESLYRFLRKFNSFSDRRYVLIRWREVLIAAVALLTLEFVPHRHEN
ncbi:phosphatidylglycerol lysyltransferase domain-containing protein [Nocardia sp. NBC_01503]|uniref:bifunctional lysylphosphatidylglycerol flippase/synthetase MprF n=1 Tax=Nocardia sp. NBC_01503 TaxID=2975997 RepID=UPI002E7B000F|nr:phosphatidylglycerol lysyltransferase domain-containing protein [Nocardia sp. NBC_01503]WTL29358.1 phosphatidylglycerol lysyltransferase domain-containing protein [Nocardia sp. NBC_01503]